LICEAETAVALRPVGGPGKVVAETELEYGEGPALLKARTWYW
jgi:hypothetical protein